MSIYLIAIEDLPSGKKPPSPNVYPLNGRFGVPKSQLRHVEGTNLLALLGIEPSFLGHPARSPVPVPYAIQAPLTRVHKNLTPYCTFQ